AANDTLSIRGPLNRIRRKRAHRRLTPTTPERMDLQAAGTFDSTRQVFVRGQDTARGPIANGNSDASIAFEGDLTFLGYGLWAKGFGRGVVSAGSVVLFHELEDSRMAPPP